MAEYVLGTVLNDALANFQRLQEQALQPQTQVFDANDPNKRMLFFAFDGTGDSKYDSSCGPQTQVDGAYGV